MNWITLPTSTELVSSVGQYTGAIFEELLPVALAIAGLFIAVLLVRFIGKSVVNAVQRMTGRGRARGGARRRVI
jgi:small neutral amino acid transporter SnatA (MarC family)